MTYNRGMGIVFKILVENNYLSNRAEKEHIFVCINRRYIYIYISDESKMYGQTQEGESKPQIFLW
jgi:hypothetical protein